MAGKTFLILPCLPRSQSDLEQQVCHYETHIAPLGLLDGIIVIVNVQDGLQVSLPEPCAGTISLLILPPEAKSCGNQKLDAIYFAVRIIRDRWKGPFDILLYDDDVRPSASSISATKCLLADYAVVYGLCKLTPCSLLNMIDTAGFYVFNGISSRPQIWANLALADAQLIVWDSLTSDHLYDERYLLEVAREARRMRLAYILSPTLSVHGSKNLISYVTQRLRYAYENLATPSRFLLDLTFLPALFLTAAALGAGIALLFVVLIWASLTAVAAAYRATLPRASRAPFAVTALSILWYAPYPLLSWLALALRLSVGIRFGPSRVKQP